MVAATIFASTLTLPGAQIAENTSWGIYLDMEAFKQSSIFDAIISFKDSAEINKIRKYLRTKLNFDTRTDLKSIILYGNGQRDNVVVAIKGSFDRPLIESVIAKRKGHQKSDALGFTCLSFNTRDKLQKYLTFVDDETVIISHSKKDLTNALSIVSGIEKGRAFSVESKTSGNIFLIGFLNFAGLDQTLPRTDLLRQINYTDFMLTIEDKGIRYSALIDAVDENAAASIEGIFNGILSLARLQFANNPEKLGFLNKSLKINRKDSSLWITTEVIESGIIKRILSEIHKKKPKNKPKKEN